MFHLFFTDNFPKLKSRPGITVALVNNKVQIKCSIEPVETTPNVRHEIKFYEGAVKRNISTKVLEGNQKEATITNFEDGVEFELGNEVV